MAKLAAKKMAKKTVKKAAKKSAARHPVKRRAQASVIKRLPPGYSMSPAGILQPTPGVVPAGKLADGFSKARREIQNFLQEVVDTATQDFEIAEIELAASFNADGKFLGFGVGGEATITIRIRPTET